MNPTASFRNVKGWIVALWAMSVVPAMAVRYLRWENVRAASLEAVLLLAALLILSAIRSIRTFIEQLPSSWLFFLVVFLPGALFAQFAQINNVIFPFTSWYMYATTDKTQTVDFQEYQGITASGNTIPLNPSRTFPPLRRGILTYHMEHLGKALEPAEVKEQVLLQKDAGSLKKLAHGARIFLADYLPLEKAEMEKRLKAILKAVVRRYNQELSRDPLVAVEVIRGTVDLSSLPHSSVTRRTAAHYEVHANGELV